MTEQEEIITSWEKAQIAYDVWFETLRLKHKTGETIYTQLKDVWNHAALDVKKINSLASEQLTAAEARLSELQAELLCERSAVELKNNRIKELEAGLKGMINAIEIGGGYSEPLYAAKKLLTK